MKIAAASYPLSELADWKAYSQKLDAWVSDAKAHGADLLVFPEYALMEVASLSDATDIHGQAAYVAERFDEIEALHCDLAKLYGLHILMGSGPAWLGRKLVNRAALISPHGVSVHQDKQIMTRYERDPWGIVGGGLLRVFETALGKIGVLICYDCEFPLLARQLSEAGVEILLCPSATEGPSGYWRVRIGAMARALEGQCVSVQASLVGMAPWCPAVDVNTGAGGVFGPPDHGFPSDGVIALGDLNKPGWVMADVELDTIAHVRADGHVLNRLHWSEQTESVQMVETCRLF